MTIDNQITKEPSHEEKEVIRLKEEAFQYLEEARTALDRSQKAIDRLKETQKRHINSIRSVTHSRSVTDEEKRVILDHFKTSDKGILLAADEACCERVEEESLRGSIEESKKETPEVTCPKKETDEGLVEGQSEVRLPTNDSGINEDKETSSQEEENRDENEATWKRYYDSLKEANKGTTPPPDKPRSISGIPKTTPSAAIRSGSGDT